MEITALTTLYSFILAILIFLASKYLDTLESIRKIIVENFDKLRGSKQEYNLLKGGMYYKIAIGILILSGIIIDSYLLIRTIFSENSITPLEILLLIIVAVTTALIFIEQIINIMKILNTAYLGNIDEEIDKLDNN